MRKPRELKCPYCKTKMSRHHVEKNVKFVESQGNKVRSVQCIGCKAFITVRYWKFAIRNPRKR